jgi:hypothetical protein
MENHRSSDPELHRAPTGGPEMKEGFAPGERAGTQIGRELINEGMEVVGSNGEYIGAVKEIREKDFLVDRRVARDVYVPFSAIAKSDGRNIFLNIPSDKMDDMDWERAPLMGTREDRSVFPD